MNETMSPKRTCRKCKEKDQEIEYLKRKVEDLEDQARCGSFNEWGVDTSTGDF